MNATKGQNFEPNQAAAAEALKGFKYLKPISYTRAAPEQRVHKAGDYSNHRTTGPAPAR